MDKKYYIQFSYDGKPFECEDYSDHEYSKLSVSDEILFRDRISSIAEIKKFKKGTIIRNAMLLDEEGNVVFFIEGNVMTV